MSTRRVSLISGIGLESFVLFALLLGCSSSTMNANPPKSSGGSTNGTTGGLSSTAGGAGGNVGSTAGSTGGTNATGAAATAGTGGVAVTATGGTVATTTDGTVTTGTGGSIGATGGAATGTGGSSTAATGGATEVDCNPPVATHCTGTLPPAALISDFSIATGATAPVVFGTWGQSIFGGAYTYPGTGPACGTGIVSAYPLTQTTTGGNWNIQGTVGTYSGLGLWWSCNTSTAAAPAYAGACAIDASAYTGISFTVSGSIGPVSKGTGTVGLMMGVSTPSTTAPTTDSAGNPKNCGTCTAATCGSSVAVPVTATATTVTFTWAQLGVTTPNAITGISFSFTDPFSLNNGYATSPFIATPYPVNISIDDLQFTP